MNTPPRLLIADDNPTNRLILARSLQDAGYDVLTADDGLQAIRIATQRYPDLILLDMVMPERDGLEVCRLLKSQTETALVPIIFVTAVSDSDQILEAFAAGGCDYVTKPFRLEEVLARVSVHIRLRQAEEELRLKNAQMEKLTGELSEANVELANLSRIDSLTTLLNRRTWEQVAEQEHVRFQRYGHAYSILMVDVDNFKVFNDSRGHQAGDECLRTIAKSIRSVCRRGDNVGRFGGEEFVVLTPQTPPEEAVKLAERIRKAVWALAIPHTAPSSPGRVTISLGVATSTGETWEDVLKEADDALYVAKRAGRNMVFNADGTSMGMAARAARLRAGGGWATTPDGVDTSAMSTGSTDAALSNQVSVLVVDDEKTNRVLIKTCLERAGYHVREAVDGYSALASIQESPPHVIVMDVMMPEMDGLECTRRLRAAPETCDIPIIVASALADSEDILAGLEAGADEYLTKPIRTTELTLRVRSMARQYQDRTDLMRSFQMRGEQVRILLCLVEFCREIGTSRCLDEVLQHAVEAVAQLTYCRRISIMLPEGEEQRLRIVKCLGMDEEFAATIAVPFGGPIAGQVFATGRFVVINREDDSRQHAGASLTRDETSELGDESQTAFSSFIPHISGAYDSAFFTRVPLISIPLQASGSVIGVLNVTERVGHRPFESRELEYVELIGKVTATAIHDHLTRQASDRASDAIMVALAKLAEHRDNDTGRHLDRVTRYCCMLAEQLREDWDFHGQIDDVFLHSLTRAVPLHDIGKVAVPDSILLHPGRLTAQQMDVMRTHAATGARTIRTLVERTPGVAFLEMAADIAHYHHEWYDGSGYPLGLKGSAIPLSARITAVADVYDALTTKRVYKDPISHDKAMAIMVESSGTQFDPAIIEAFVMREQDFADLAVTMADEENESDNAADAREAQTITR